MLPVVTFIQEETEDADKGRTDIIPEIGLIAETGVSTTIITEIEEIIKIRTIMVLEILEIGAEIPRIIDLIIEGKVPAKGMTKGLDIEVPVENVTDPGPGIKVNFETRYRNNQSRSREGKGPEKET